MKVEVELEVLKNILMYELTSLFGTQLSSLISVFYKVELTKDSEQIQNIIAEKMSDVEQSIGATIDRCLDQIASSPQ